MRKYYFMSIALSAILVTSIGGQSAFAIMGTDVIPAGGTLDFYELLDGSGSISNSDFQLELDGTIAALNAAIVGPSFGPLRITIIQFGSNSVVECQTMVNSQATLNTLTACIAAIVKDDGGTSMAAAYNTVTAELGTSPLQGANDRSIVDLVTDGAPNSPSGTTTAVAAAVAAGLDSNVALAVGAGANSAFLATITHPDIGAPGGPIDPNPIPDPLVEGFVLTVQGFQQFEDAMKQKFDVIVPTVGGELLSIDTSALILAGAQTNAVWIMSALAAIGSVAFGAIYLKTRKN